MSSLCVSHADIFSHEYGIAERKIIEGYNKENKIFKANGELSSNYADTSSTIFCTQMNESTGHEYHRDVCTDIFKRCCFSENVRSCTDVTMSETLRVLSVRAFSTSCHLLLCQVCKSSSGMKRKRFTATAAATKVHGKYGSALTEETDWWTFPRINNTESVVLVVWSLHRPTRTKTRAELRS